MADQDMFEEREKSEEARYKLGEELKFKARSRRNRLLGLWAAEKMGMAAEAAADYAADVVGAATAARTDADLVAKVKADLDARGFDILETVIEDEMVRLYEVAYRQVAEEYPMPLGPDHEQVGG